MASLNAFTQPLGKRLAAHLLRRTTYRVTAVLIEEFALLTPSQAINKLFQQKPLQYPNGPLSWTTNPGSPIFQLGSLNINGGNTNNQMEPVFLWRVYEATNDSTIRWKIVEWFSSLFTYSYNGSHPFPYHYVRLLHAMSNENLRTLALKITFDNGMLGYLNNSQNRNGSINENYAREFLELFTILKGEAIGVGNYTNYTEADITTAAKVLSGYVTGSKIDSDTGIVRGEPKFNRHVSGNKTFSSAFQNKTIIGATTEADIDREVKDFVDMIFNQMETAKAYIRKMYQFFVSDRITSEIENDIITPLATQLKNNGYKHIPVLKTLLQSQHFFDRDDSNPNNEIIGSKIKSPMELVLQTVGIFELQNTSAGDNQKIFSNDTKGYDYHFVGMSKNGPPTVEGYPGFYKDPSYSRNWFKSNTIIRRYSLGKTLLRGRISNPNTYFPYKIDIVTWVKAKIDLPGAPGTPTSPIGASDATRVVDMLISYLLPEKPTGSRYDYFMNSFLGDLSPINWYFSWNNYRLTSDDSDVRVGLERLFVTLISSPEFQTF